MRALRKSGVYPFNPAAIPVNVNMVETDKTSPSSTEGTASAPVTTTPTAPEAIVSATVTPVDVSAVSMEFTAGEIALFERRLEEGYNIPDARYIAWLELHHPEAVPACTSVLSNDVSLSDQFQGVTPLDPIQTVSTPLPVNHTPIQTLTTLHL